jgi:hypothetical protein
LLAPGCLVDQPFGGVTDLVSVKKVSRLFCINVIVETKPRHGYGGKINLSRYCKDASELSLHCLL